MATRWSPGDVVVRREQLGLLPDGLGAQPCSGVWLEMPVVVVEDHVDRLVTFIAPGTPFRFPPGPWPTPDGRHPWAGRAAWTGHGCLMVQVPGEHHAIWHFWEGPQRAFRCWYLNLQTAFARSSDGYATQDLELDVVVGPALDVVVKDDELLDQRVTEGRFTPTLVDWIRRYGAALTDRLAAGGPWWDRSWAAWQPPDA